MADALLMESIDEMEEILVEYTEVGYLHRLLNFGDDKYFKWIAECQSKSELREFIRRMKIVVDPKTAKSTQVSVLLGITRFAFGMAVSMAIGVGLRNVTNGSNLVTKIAINSGTSYAGVAASQAVKQGYTSNEVRRFIPMIEAAEKRLEVLRDTN